MDKNKKYVCIHGHYYQPPRENAWLEMVEIQESAAPFHDWNERITAECYGPNASARILDGNGYICKVVNNYAKISFNFGPSLLSWMEIAEPDAYRTIIEADQESCQYFDGHGSALAQVYNHLIMPLANHEDKHTQVIWGIRDFEHRFGRKPKGMWLAETAVDLDTLEVLLDHGIEFTILAPRQAKAIRSSEGNDWTQLDHAAVDPRRPYKCVLKSGRTITLFFYDGHVSQGVAFSGLLNDGKAFAKSIINSMDNNDTLQLAHIATDGESYGHHHGKGEMALADCLDFISKSEEVTLCNYASFMAQHTASWEVGIYENSSWSCVHGVERWRSNCGCQADGNRGWTQAWRQPLRETLDWLRDELIPIYEQQSALYLKEPWAARNEYINVILDRSDAVWQQFLDKHCLRGLNSDEARQLRQLLEMQRQSMLMFTSCGWFFDEVSGLETNQILQYAQRAIAYAKSFSDKDLHSEFLDRLEQTHSNKYGNAANSYRKYVEPVRVNLSKIAMHFALANLHEPTTDKLSLFNFNSTSESYEKVTVGDQNLILGRMHIQSDITLVQQSFSYAIWQNSDHFIGQLSTKMSEADFAKMKEDVKAVFKNNTGRAVESMQKYFDGKTFSFEDLLKDSQRQLLDYLSKDHLKAIKQTLRTVYERENELMTRILNSPLPVPKLFQDTTQTVLNEDLNILFQSEKIDINRLKEITAEFVKWDRKATTNSYFRRLLKQRILARIKALQPKPECLNDLQELLVVFEQMDLLKIKLTLLKSQNLFYSRYKEMTSSPAIADHSEWQEAILRLGEILRVRV